MEWQASWIKTARDMGDVCPVFEKNFALDKKVEKATLFITAMGVYEAMLNGKRVGEFVLAPGWTVYRSRLQYQAYDVTGMLQENNELAVTVGKGWYHSPMQGWQYSPYQAELHKKNMGLLAQLEVNYEDGSAEVIATDDTWLCEESQVRFSEIYDGETYDASYVSADKEAVEIYEEDMSVLIAQEGEDVREMDRISARNIFVTPAGETVVDFGQNLTGYVEIQLTAKAGDRVELSHAEVMDQQGNFYTENYRSAKAKYIYTCKDGQQSYKPKLTFFGFRYIRVDQFPGEVKPENFTAVVVHSNMKRTGYLRSSNPLLNQLFDNIIWGQKGNFVDVPTDCPQRDERLGWTGDAEIFIRTACMNYDAEKFFAKWLADMEADQLPDGGIPMVVPNVMGDEESGAAWGDAAAVCPWEL